MAIMSTDQEFGTRLLQALGIKPDAVRAVVVTLDAGAPARVKVERWTAEEPSQRYDTQWEHYESPIGGSVVGCGIDRVFGLDPKDIQSIVLDCRWDDVVAVYIRRMVRAEEAEPLLDALRGLPLGAPTTDPPQPGAFETSYGLYVSDLFDSYHRSQTPPAEVSDAV